MKKLKILLLFFIVATKLFAEKDQVADLEETIKSLEIVIALQQEKLSQNIQEISTENNIVLEEVSDDILNEEKDIIIENDDHRLTLRIPKSLIAKIDIARKQRIGKISRNLWILETIEKATKKIKSKEEK